jgi:hypothetical protein
MAAAVVANRSSNIFRNAAQRLQQIVQTLRLELGMLLERGVQVGHVCVVVLAMMNLHRLPVDVGLERV